jgi:hypothetical protein
MRRQRLHELYDRIALPVKDFFRSLDWQLLLFLVLFLDVKIVCKLIAIVFIYAFRPTARFGLRRKGSRLPLFYMGMIGIALVDWLLYRLYADRNYTITLLCGILGWMLCLLAIHQVKLSVERSGAPALHRTLLVFFAINAVLSFLMLARIMVETRTINPYTYQGNFQQYFLGTGDYIRGLTFDTSSTNAFINAFGVLYFLYRKRAAMLLTCMSVLLLTGSNATTLLLLIALAWPFFFRSDREQKSLIVVCCFLAILFFVKISPQNHIYVAYKTEQTIKGGKIDDSVANQIVPRITDRPDSELDPEQRKLKIAIQYLDSVSYLFWLSKDSIFRSQGNLSPIIAPLPKPNIHRPEYQRGKDTGSMRQRLLQFVQDEHMERQVNDVGAGCCRVPGKLIAMMQTEKFMAAHPMRLLTGDGLGRFSSKQAFRSTALGIAGKYPAGWRYIAKDFQDQHLALYLFYFAHGLELRSMLNAPDCVYDQLAAEYGLAGLALFAFLYIGFFIRHFRRLSYGIPLLFLLSAGLLTGYWFEQLSIVVLFECMIFLDIKEGGGRER